MPYYHNPYDRNRDPKSWFRWGIGEEDGAGGMKPRGKSVAYKNGYNAGRYLFVLLNSKPFSETSGSADPAQGHSH